MWSSSANPEGLIEPFVAAVEKDNASKGGFRENFAGFCETFKVIACPHVAVVKGSAEDTESVRIANCEVDISNWRAALLATTVIGSKVTEIYVHNCTLSPKHIADLATALARIGTIRTLKMQYIDFGVDGGDSALGEAIKQLFSDSCGLTLISMQHCGLQDSIGQSIAAALSTNFVLNGINLSNNQLTDISLKALLGAVRYTGNVQYLVLRNNLLKGSDIFAALVSQFLGAESTAADDASIKAAAKALGDKNKAIKENNKKRKKAGHVELAELALPELTRKQGKQVFFSNATLEVLDLAGNAEVEPATILDLANQLARADGETLGALRFQARFSVAAFSADDSSTLSKFEQQIKLVEC